MADADAPLLSCRNVTKRFGALAAVSDLSFEVAEGEVLGIGGPNGAGKTTLFETISGLSPVSEGEIHFAGRRIDRLSPESICHAGIARTFQLNAAFDSLTVWENALAAATFGREARFFPGFRHARAAAEQAEEALVFAGLTEGRDRIAENLPVLDRKLLMIAGALATKPRLLLMDEPVGGLTPTEIDRVVAVVERIRAAGITVVLIEHVMRFLVQLSDRVMILHHGEKIYEGSAAGLVRDRTVVDVYLGAGASERLASFLEQQEGPA